MMSETPELLCVLIVDDHDSSREALEEGIAGQGYEVVAAATGEEALKQLESRPIDIVVTDLKLPDRSGMVKVLSSSIARPVALDSCALSIISNT